MSEEQVEILETARDKAVKAATEKNAAIPKDKVGPRWKVGATRGKNPQIITFEFLDQSMPDTLPKSVPDFMAQITDNTDTLLEYLIRGYNDAKQEAASDPLAEYVSDVWAPDVQLTFRTAVRNYAKGLGMELEKAVEIIRPGFAAKFGQ